MLHLRATAFNAYFVLWSLLLGVPALPMILLGPAAVRALARLWVRGTLAGLRTLCGLTHRVEGLEHLPEGPAIVAAKHQSAWETLAFNVLLPDCAFVLKRELFWLPVVGWFIRHSGMVGLDRRAGAGALRGMVVEARAVLAQGRRVVVFPEGTRTAPGAQLPYFPGVAALYGQLDAPVVPVALNSGLFWGRRSYVKRPGVITVRVLPPLPPDLPRKAFLDRLRADIEAACRELT